MPKLNRRNFVAALATAGAGGVLVPLYLKGTGSTSPPPLYPYVQQTATYTMWMDPTTGAYTIPAGCPVGFHAINETAIGSINTIVPSQPLGVPPPADLAAFDWYAINNPPTGFSSATPQVAILEIVVVVAVLAIGGYFVYKIYKWASQLPPPDTNVYR